MKNCMAFFAAAVLFAAGCASSSNQKLETPFIGTVRNTYNVYNISLDKDASAEQVSNVVRQVKSLSAGREDQRSPRLLVGRGSCVIAVDNQTLVGRDIGNVSSNDVNASASIPISL